MRFYAIYNKNKTKLYESPYNFGATNMLSDCAGDKALTKVNGQSEKPLKTERREDQQSGSEECDHQQRIFKIAGRA